MKFKDFIEYETLRLNEMPIAKKGSWKTDEFKKYALFGKRNYKVLKCDWKKFSKQVLLKDAKTLSIEFWFLQKNEEMICIGGYIEKRENEEEYDFVTIIALITRKSPQKIKNKTLYQTKKVMIDSEQFRGKGIGESLYSTIIESGFNIVCDTFQFDGARKLWKNLSKNYRVSVYNSFDKEITKEPHLIINTDFENLDDEWSRDIDLEHTHLLFVIYK